MTDVSEVRRCQDRCIRGVRGVVGIRDVSCRDARCGPGLRRAAATSSFAVQWNISRQSTVKAMSFASVMLDRAKWFHAHAPESPRLPNRFGSEDEAVRAFTQAQLFEAHECFANPVGPQPRPLSAVDLGTPSPGIIERDGTGSRIRRASAEVTRPTCYDRVVVEGRPRQASKPVPARRVELALTRAEATERAKTRRVAEGARARTAKRTARIATKRAVTESEAEAASDEDEVEAEARFQSLVRTPLQTLVPLASTEAPKAVGQAEPEQAEQAEHIGQVEQTEQAEQAKQAEHIEQAEQTAEQAEHTGQADQWVASSSEDATTVAADVPAGADGGPPPAAVTALDAPGAPAPAVPLSTARQLALRRATDPNVELVARDQEANGTHRARHDGNPVGMLVFESPVPHDRHLSALAACGVHPELLPTLLAGTPPTTPCLRVIEGPPGTGKTTRLLDDLQAFLKAASPATRVLVCAPTNAGAADLYVRALRRGVMGHLSLAPESIPVGVPRTPLVPIESAAVLFCTVSGRNSTRVRNLVVHAVFLDEAALCPEALTWGLLRPETHFLYMVGDTKQLSAVVSDAGRPLAHGRSMMERLGAIGVAVEHLNEQRRMDPQMLEYPNRAFYNGALRTSADRTPDRCGGAAPYAVVQVTGVERRVGTSYCNPWEAEVAVALALAMQRRRGEGRVHILVPYTAALKAVNDLGTGVSVSTIDSFQGKENDAVILCVTRVGHEGFWSNPRRLVVALTRARYELRVVGDFASFQCELSLGKLATDAQQRGLMWSEAEALRFAATGDGA